MSVRVGWGFSRPKRRKPHQLGGDAKLFGYLKTKETRVRLIAVGVVMFRRDELERLRTRGQWLDATVVGLVRFARDVTPELVKTTTTRLKVTGLVLAPEDVKRAIP